MRLVARLMAALLVATLILPALGVSSVFAAAATHLSVLVSPSSGTAGSQFDVTVTALDATETIDPTYTGTITFTSTDTGPSTVLPSDYTFQLTDLGSVTFSNGATLTKSGSRTITATDTVDGSIDGTSNSVTISAASADHIVLTGTVTNLASGAGRTFTATIFDQFDNILTSDGSTVVSFDQTAGTGSVSGEGTDTAAAGVASKVITGNIAGTVTITASASGLPDSNDLTFTVVAGAVAEVDLSGSIGNLTAGTTRVLTATLKDAAGNIRTADNSTVVTFAKSGGAGTVTGLGNDTATAGVASVTVTGAGAGSIDLEATASAVTSNTLTFTVVVGAASQIVLSGSTGNLASGGTRILTATITDAGGNTITTDNATDISFDKTAGAGTVTGEGTDTVTAGVATKTLTGALAGSVTITASASGLPDSNTLTFTVVPGSVSQVVLSGGTGNLASGATRVLTATLKDAAGNTLTNDNTTSVTFAKSGGAGTVSGLASDTATAGVASVTVTGVLAGSIDLEATASAVTSNTLTFTIVPGAASQIVLSGSTTNLTSGATRVLTATIEDAAGNVRTGDTPVVTFSKTGGAGTVSGLGAPNAVAGVASVTVTGVLAGSIDIHATGASLTSNTLTFTIVPGAASQLVLSGAITNLTSGSTRVLTATLQDAAGNTRTGDSTTVVTFAKTAGAGTVSGLGTDQAAAGVATVTVTGVLVGSITLDATSPDPLTSNTLTFTVVVGAASQIVLSGATTNLASGTTRVLTATIEDAAGNVRTGDSTVVTFAKTAGTGTVTGLGNDAALAGVAQVTVTGELVGSIDIEATAGALTRNTLTFTVVPGTTTQLVLTGGTSNLTSGATRVLTATLRDAAGNVETGDSTSSVTFSKTAGAGTVTGLGSSTAAAGIAQLTVTGELVGSITLHATGASLTSNTLTFTVVVGAAAQIALTGLTTNLASGTTRAITATIQDAAGNTRTADSATVVTFAQTAGSGTVTGTGNDTSASGVASVTLTGALVGSATFTASASGLPDSNTLTFTIVPGVATSIVQTGLTTNLASGSTRVLTATIYDAAGNVETGDNSTVITFSKTAGAGTVTGLGTDTVTNGVASVTVTGALIGSISTHSTGASLTSNTQTFTVVVGPAAEIVLSGSTGNLASGSTRVLTATIVDGAGNVESGDNSTVVTFAKTAGTGTVTDLGNATAAGGVAQLTVTGELVGPVTITASASGLPNSNTLPFTVVVGPLDSIAISPQTATVDPGVAQAYTIEAFDAAGNSRGDVTSATTLGIDGGGSCNNTLHTCQALTEGPHTVTATHLTKVDNAIQTINSIPPDAVDDSGIFVNEDAVAFPIDVLNNDSDANGDGFTITSVTQGSFGTVAIAPDDLSVTYTPNANVSGAETFTYTITDDNLDTDTATVSLTVIALNDAPSFTLGTDPTVLEDAGPTTVVGFSTGSPGPADEAGQTLTYVIDGNTNPGLFAVGFEPTIAPNGDLTFTPADETSGTATITVHLVDNGPNGGGDVNISATQTFDVNVTIVDDSPVAVADGVPTAYRVKAGVALVVNAASGVLTNDTDVDTTHNLLTAAVDVQGLKGIVVLNADGSFTYTPNDAIYVGPDSFTYHANDGNSDSNIVSVTIDIYLNHAPTAVGDIVTVVQGSGYTPVSLLTNDNAANPDAPETITIVAKTNPLHGSVTITGGGTGMSYRPGANYTGSDTFTYTISDGVFTSTASVLVKVPKDTYKPVATAPNQTFSAQTIGTSTVRARLTWTGTDKGYGISRFELWRSVNGHAYTRVLTTTGHQAYMTLNVASSYRFRVRAIDKKANVGAFAYGPKFTVYRYQETTSSATYSSPWTTLNSSAYSGGHAKGTSTAGFDVTFTTLARTIAFVTDVAPSRGTADVYIDGVLAAHLTLTQSATKYRYLAYSITFASSAVHSMRVVYTGGPTKRVDADAFVFLR